MNAKSNYPEIDARHAVFAIALIVGSLQILAAGPATAAEVGPQLKVKNEAVRVVDGNRSVELPPKLTKGPGRSGLPATWESVYVIETPTGLFDCNNSYYDSKSCEPSSLGKQKRHRKYVVKVNERWLSCSSRDVEKTCFVIGGGQLMPMDSVWE